MVAKINKFLAIIVVLSVLASVAYTMDQNQIEEGTNLDHQRGPIIPTAVAVDVNEEIERLNEEIHLLKAENQILRNFKDRFYSPFSYLCATAKNDIDVIEALMMMPDMDKISEQDPSYRTVAWSIFRVSKPFPGLTDHGHERFNMNRLYVGNLIKPVTSITYDKEHPQRLFYAGSKLQEYMDGIRGQYNQIRGRDPLGCSLEKDQDIRNLIERTYYQFVQNHFGVNLAGSLGK